MRRHTNPETEGRLLRAKFHPPPSMQRIVPVGRKNSTSPLSNYTGECAARMLMRCAHAAGNKSMQLVRSHVSV